MSVVHIQNRSCSIRIPRMTEADCAQKITLRPVTAGDEGVLLEIYKSSRGDDLRGLGWTEDRVNEFLGMQYEAQKNFLANEYERAADELILCEGTRRKTDRRASRTRD